MRENKKRKVIVRIGLNAIAIVLFNLTCSFVGIAVFATYYTPGNPRPPDRMDIDTIGFLGVFIGVSQLLYLIPFEICAVRSRKWNLAIGGVLGGIVTALLNVLFLLEISKRSGF